MTVGKWEGRDTETSEELKLDRHTGIRLRGQLQSPTTKPSTQVDRGPLAEISEADDLVYRFSEIYPLRQTTDRTFSSDGRPVLG